jgi:hypothetical protein
LNKSDYNNWEEYRKDYKRNWSLLKKYKIDLKEFRRLSRDQGDCCKLCGRHRSVFKIEFAVDHDHDTGKIRGLLCRECNVMLGRFEQMFGDTKMVAKFLEYLKAELKINI